MDGNLHIDGSLFNFDDENDVLLIVTGELAARTMGFSRMSKKVTQALENAYSLYLAQSDG